MCKKTVKTKGILILVFMLSTIISSAIFSQSVFAADVTLEKTGWTVSAFGYYNTAGTMPQNMLDGIKDNTHRWASGANQTIGNWVLLDMKKPQVISYYTLENNSVTDATGYGRSFKTMISNDGINFTEVAAINSYAAATSSAVFSTPQTARFIKIEITANFAGWWNIHEINVLGPKIFDEFQSPLYWDATAISTSGTNAPQKMIDGMFGDNYKWTSSASQQIGDWVQIDMKENINLNKVVLFTPSDGTGYARSFQVYVSTDTNEWGAPVATGAGNAGQTVVTFTSKKGRYIKIVLTQSDADVWSIQEFNAYGTSYSRPLNRTDWTPSANYTYTTEVATRIFDSAIGAGKRWVSGVNQANSPVQWVQVDMKVPTTINKILMNAEISGGFPNGFQVFVSNDAVNWGDPIVTAVGRPLSCAVFDPVTTRYFKIQISSANTAQWWAIHELDVWAPSQSIPADSVKLIRTGWTAVSSNTTYYQTQTPDKMFDGISGPAANRWASNKTQAIGDYIIVDMKNPAWINAISLFHAYENAFPRGCAVYLSTDGVNWGTAVATVDGQDEMIINFPYTYAQYVKVVLTKTWASGWWCVHELNVYTSSTASPLKINPLSYYVVDGQAETDITLNVLKTGKIRVKVKTTNISETETFTGELLVALYNKNTKELAGFKSSGEINLPSGANDLSADLDIASNLTIKDYKLKVFLWDGISTLVPLQGMNEF